MFCERKKKGRMTFNPEKKGVGAFQTEESEFLSNSLDIFGKPSIEASLLEGKTVEHNPLNAITVSGPIEFVIPSHSHNEYTYLPLTRLIGEVAIYNATDTKLAAGADVSFCNLFPSSLFKQVEVEINGIQVNDVSTATYGYKAFIETLLSYGRGAKDTHLKAAYWIDDSQTKEEEKAIANSDALKKRNSFIAESKSLFFSTPVHIDCFQSPRLLPPGCNIKVKFIRNEDNFSLIAAQANYKIKLIDLKLSTRKVHVHDSIVTTHEKLFNTMSASYPLAMTQIKTFVLNKGVTNETISNVIRGKLPRQLIFGLLDNKSFNGTISSNPFVFKPFDLKYVALKKNGVSIPPAAYQPDFTKDKYMREYRSFIDSIGIGHEDESVEISPTQWKTVKNLWAYDLSPMLCNGYHLHSPESGYIDIDLAFNTELPDTVILLVYSVFNTTLFINKESSCSS